METHRDKCGETFEKCTELCKGANPAALSRRKFMKICLAGAGAAALGLGLPSASNVIARGGEATKGQPGNGYIPGYIALANSGELERREQALFALLAPCRLCPRLCAARRTDGLMGICGTADTFKVASYGPHFGNERALVGAYGSGNIFFSNCNLLCVFCQNWQINHRGDGRLTTHAALADIMISLQRMGCHNINLVTPTHLIPHLVRALRLAIADGLNIPLLYNTSAYDSLEVIQLLDGVVDIYLPDFKFQASEIAAHFLNGARGYMRHAAAAIKEMHRQVGALDIVDGIANRGLLVRHLVLPENLAGTDVFVRWVVSELGADTHVNIMGQFRPEFRARYYPPLDRRITQQEFDQAMRWAREAGLQNFH